MGRAQMTFPVKIILLNTLYTIFKRSNPESYLFCKKKCLYRISSVCNNFFLFSILCHCFGMGDWNQGSYLSAGEHV